MNEAASDHPALEPGTAGDDLQVVIVEDHLAVRKGVELLLRSEGIRVIGVAETFAEAERIITERRPDVAILDIRLGSESGLDVAHAVLAADPEAGVLIYTGEVRQELLREALECGARGFACKSGDPAELLTAIRTVAAGGEYVDARLASTLRVGTGAERSTLTPREREVLTLLADGLSNAEAAERLALSPLTVDTHVRNAMRKLGARTRVHALALAIKLREIEVVAD